MRNNSRDSVNSIVRDFKKNLITESDAIHKISKKMYPLYIKTNRRMVPFDMSTHPNGDLYNVYLETIQYSLKSFRFSKIGSTTEVFSFIPYFQSMFSNRSRTFIKNLSQRLYESNRTVSIQDKFEESDWESGEVSNTLPETLTCSIESSIDHQSNLINHITSHLSTEEYYILDHRLRSFSFHSISNKMKRDKVTFSCSHQMVCNKWNVIKNKVGRLIKEWKNASCN